MENNEIITPPVSPPKINLKNILIGVGIGVLITAFPALAYVNRLQLQTDKNVDNSPTPTRITYNRSPTQTPIPSQSPTPTDIKLADLNLGQITWLSSPKIVKIYPFLKANAGGYVDQFILEDVNFHHTATFSDGSKLINAIIPFEGMGIYYDIDRFIQSPDGKIYFVFNNNQTTVSPKYLNSSVGFVNLNLSELEIPPKIETSKESFAKSGSGGDIISFTQLKNPQLIEEVQYGRLYAVYSTKPVSEQMSSLGFINRNIWLRLKDDTVYPYSVSPPFITDNKYLLITWNDSVITKSNYNHGFVGGCGSLNGSYLTKDSPLLNKLVVSGITNTGDKIYTLNDQSSQFFQYIYDGLDSNRRPTFSTFLTQKNHFFWPDKLGDWWVFIYTDYEIAAECGKPVIYLYPETSTQVSVKVGADVTVSEPLYPASGWTVLAHPDGTLDYQGRSYTNLFWEGKGHGPYPSISSQGFVVSQNDLILTIKNHLKLLGLNSQESSDFLEFWQPRLPSSPFVRLTWLGTDDMNRLAPLQVTPRPDTVIRIFLDFAPLDKFENLTPQKLSAPKRNGFTLIEWGGLLIK
jgi:hypothetical protein